MASTAVVETVPASPGSRGDAPPPRRWSRLGLSSNLRQSGIYVAFVIIVAVFAVLTDGSLLRPNNIENLIVQNSYILVLAIGMILIIIAGHIDLSVGSVVAVCSAVAAVLMVHHHVPWPLAVVATIAVGAAIGAWQGFWIAYFGIPAFIVTLAGMLLFRALTMAVLGNTGISPFPGPVRTLTSGYTGSYLGNVGLGPLGGADLFSLLAGVAAVVGWTIVRWRARVARQSYQQAVDPLGVFGLKVLLVAVVVMAVVVQLARASNLPFVLVMLAALVLGYTVLTGRGVFGRHIYAVGGNLQAAVLSGVKARSVVFWIFVNMGALAAVAGVVFAGALNQANTTAGTNFELEAIAAAFIGGAAVQGGVGKVMGAITGGLIMGVINNGMSLLSAAPEASMFVKGSVLLAAVAFDVWAKRRAGVAG